MTSLTGYQAMTMQKRKTSMRRKLNWKKLLTLSFKNSTNNTEELVEWEEMTMTGMMMILLITTSFKLRPCSGNKTDCRQKKQSGLPPSGSEDLIWMAYLIFCLQ